MTTAIIGAVFAGGASRRLGSDKATALVEGRTLLERAVTLLDGFFPRVVVSAGASTAISTAHEVVRDRRPDHGPLAGLEAVLEAASGAPVFVLACDLPLIDERVVRRIVQTAGGDVLAGDPRAWIASGAERVQPLCGVYAADCLGAVRHNLEIARLSMRGLLDRLEVALVDVGDLSSEVLLNVNRPEDLARAREAVGER